jgi:hypothetical protein
MTTQKTLNVLGITMIHALLLWAALMGSISLAHAQTTTNSPHYTPTGTSDVVPVNYMSTGTNGVYYNATTGMYYDAQSGFYSTNAPSGAGALNADGSYVMPAGYYNSVYGTFYNPATQTYYDPRTGMYTTSVPTGPISTSATGSTSMTGNTNPGLPNTGAGGDATASDIALIVSGVAVLAGGAFLTRRLVLTR